jgi:phage gp36-like protein
MSYCTIGDILGHLPADVVRRLSNDTDKQLVVNNDIINGIIDEQSNIIDSYIIVKYELPITDSNGLSLLNTICHDLTIAELFQRRFPLDDSATNKNRRQNALDMLTNLVNPKGTQRLNGSNQKIESTYIAVSSSPKFATDRRLRQFMNVNDRAMSMQDYYEQDIKGWRR